MNKRASEKERRRTHPACSCRRRERAQRTVSKAREASRGWSSNKRRRVRHCGSSSSSSMAETGFSQSKIIPTIAQICLFDNNSTVQLISCSFSSSSFTHETLMSRLHLITPHQQWFEAFLHMSASPMIQRASGDSIHKNPIWFDCFVSVRKNRGFSGAAMWSVSCLCHVDCFQCHVDSLRGSDIAEVIRVYKEG